MKSVAVLGGCGYLGSVVINELKKVDCSSDIYDCVLYSDEYSEHVKYEHVDVFQNGVLDKPMWNTYDAVIWMLDIDDEDFYTFTESEKYCKRNIHIFSGFAEKLKDKLILVTDFYCGNNESYAEFLSNKIQVCRNNGCKIFRLASLFGPAPRMRFDTLLNDMFRQAYSGGLIYVQDWLDRIPVCSVAVAGEFIAKNLFENFVYVNVCNAMHSKVEYAHMVNRIFERKPPVVVGDSYGGNRNKEFVGVDNELVPFGEYTLKKSFEHMLKGLEKGVVQDIEKDSYYNSRIIRNGITSSRFSTFLNECSSTVI